MNRSYGIVTESINENYGMIVRYIWRTTNEKRQYYLVGYGTVYSMMVAKMILPSLKGVSQRSTYRTAITCKKGITKNIVVYYGKLSNGCNILVNNDI